eukprot:Protomagalhaensia_wolfi_Nauph_80__588@NODE_1333_length_1582_cov_56_497084_g1029_i0_p1_GENE_NODE_1333_length_1582_cov_56_497084_g1029_i0NODE_1333_length_1582_cov_56_497084_g1029_i0_p1_ORF_typecomplete_len273_score33_97_NODE_1333_length_1582_cov_56_497084_g1029_i0146964
MKHPNLDIEACIICEGKRLIEFEAQAWDTDSECLVSDTSPENDPVRATSAYIPAFPGAQFKVLVRGNFGEARQVPSGMWRHGDINAAVYIDGVLVASKSRPWMPDHSPFVLVFDGVRASSQEVKTFVFSSRSSDYCPDLHLRRVREQENEKGKIRIEVFSGNRAQASYTPIMRFANQFFRETGNSPSSVQESKGELGSSSIAIDYGPIRIRTDRRRAFEKSKHLAKFIFHYADPRWIDVMRLKPPIIPSPSKLPQGQIITLSDEEGEERRRK